MGYRAIMCSPHSPCVFVATAPLRCGWPSEKHSPYETKVQYLPLLDGVRSYPTTLFLHEDGRLHSVHTGFNGPGTGVEYDKLKKHFESIIEELLKS